MLAHHQLTDPRRGAPVHVPQLVADHVFPQGLERELPCGTRSTRPSRERPRRRHRGQVVQARVHTDCRSRRAPAVAARPSGSRRRPQRPGVDHAAPRGLDRVVARRSGRDASAPTGSRRGVVSIPCRRALRGASASHGAGVTGRRRPALRTVNDVGGVARRDPVGRDRRSTRAAAAAITAGRDAREGRGGDDGRVRVAPDQPTASSATAAASATATGDRTASARNASRDGEKDVSASPGPAPAARPDPLMPPKAGRGTGTASMASATIAAPVVPRTAASGVSRMRCANTGSDQGLEVLRQHVAAAVGQRVRRWRPGSAR